MCMCVFWIYEGCSFLKQYINVYNKTVPSNHKTGGLQLGGFWRWRVAVGRFLEVCACVCDYMNKYSSVKTLVLI